MNAFRKIFTVLLLVICVSFLVILPARAYQSAALELRLRRDFGYGGGYDIQGTFTLRASGPQDLSRVRFYIDDQMMAEDAEAPFELRFDTGAYSLGDHVLVAVGQTPGGELRSNEIHTRFVSASEGFAAGVRILGPMLVVILLATGLAVASAFLGAGKLRTLPPGAPRQYGVAGGAICPRCHRPFPRHVFAPNMLLGKLERCPYCGKWSVVAAAPLERLRQAEQAELEDAAAGPAHTENAQDRLRKGLDDSRYLDG